MKYLLFLIISISTSFIFAQEEVIENEKIQQTISLLFDGMRKSDSSMVRSAFLTNAGMRTTFTNKKTGLPSIQKGSLDKFLEAIGTEKNDFWDERISEVQIHLDDNLAQVWMNYSFYINEEFSHCGVNSIQLIKTSDGWKISDIADTRRAERCGK